MTQPLLRAVSSDPDTLAVQGLGATLRALRQAQGHSLSDVSARLKFSVRQIEALENEQWEQLPQGLSLRGMVKNYGRFLGTDSDALLSMLESHTQAAGSPSIALSRGGPAIEQVDLPLHGESQSRPWGWLIVLLILLVVAGFYAVDRGWIPDTWLVADWLKSLKR